MDKNMQKVASLIKASSLSKKDPLIDLVEKLFQSRDIMHLAHLKSNSYAAHVALGDYYDSVLGFADDLVETYQGCEGKLADINILACCYKEPLTHLKEMKECL